MLKGRRFNLLRNRENPTADGRADHEELLAANRGLSLVYALKNPFKQVWTYTYLKRHFERDSPDEVITGCQTGSGSIKNPKFCDTRCLQSSDDEIYTELRSL